MLNKQAYLQGFVETCQRYGINNPEQINFLIKNAQEAKYEPGSPSVNVDKLSPLEIINSVPIPTNHPLINSLNANYLRGVSGVIPGFTPTMPSANLAPYLGGSLGALAGTPLGYYLSSGNPYYAALGGIGGAGLGGGLGYLASLYGQGTQESSDSSIMELLKNKK